MRGNSGAWRPAPVVAVHGSNDDGREPEQGRQGHRDLVAPRLGKTGAGSASREASLHSLVACTLPANALSREQDAPVAAQDAVAASGEGHLAGGRFAARGA